MKRLIINFGEVFQSRCFVKSRVGHFWRASLGMNSGNWLTHLRAGVIVVGMVGACFPAAAIPFTTQLSFSAPEQSMWGPGGGSVSIGLKGDESVGPVDIGYDLGVSSGTVSAAFSGLLKADYQARYFRGSTPVGLGFSGLAGGGELHSDFGAWVKVTAAGFNLLNYDYGLNIDKVFTPQLGQSISASDDLDNPPGPSLDVLIATAGLAIDIEQTDTFKGESIQGVVASRHRNSGVTSLLPFIMTSEIGTSVDLGLSRPGTWDISFLDLSLNNSFAPSFDAEILIWEEHVDGIKVCKRCIWRLCVPIPCGLTYDRNELVLADIDIYDRSPFPLDFNNISSTQGFSIMISEPSILVLLGVGFLGIAVIANRRSREI